MFDKEHLAIASVPIQSWGKIYDENEAFDKGTIFQDLDQPFFATAGDKGPKKKGDGLFKEKQQQEELLLQIQKVSFTVDDLRLYMDTHPTDGQGLALLKTMIRKRKDLLKSFALEFYPLTADCMADIYENTPDSECYCWQEGPCPWEGVCV